MRNRDFNLYFSNKKERFVLRFNKQISAGLEEAVKDPQKNEEIKNFFETLVESTAVKEYDLKQVVFSKYYNEAENQDLAILCTAIRAKIMRTITGEDDSMEPFTLVFNTEGYSVLFAPPIAQLLEEVWANPNAKKKFIEKLKSTNTKIRHYGVGGVEFDYKFDSKFIAEGDKITKVEHPKKILDAANAVIEAVSAYIQKYLE